MENPNCVKCVTDNNGFALYFSRSKIPYERNEGYAKIYGHLGIYGYKKEALFKMTSLAQSTLELAESLEQLRALQAGMRIKTFVVDFKPIGIDTPDDLAQFEKIITQSSEFKIFSLSKNATQFFVKLASSRFQLIICS